MFVVDDEEHSAWQAAIGGLVQWWRPDVIDLTEPGSAGAAGRQQVERLLAGRHLAAE